jgi:cytochrome c553
MRPHNAELEGSLVRRILRWIGVALAGVVALALLALAGLYVASERVLRRTYDVPVSAFPVPADVALAARGQRLAAIRGCYGGCHGTALEGHVLIDDRMIARIVAPDLTRVVREYSDGELERVIRHGVRRNGISTLAMPSAMFYNLTDDDLRAIIAFLRSQPVSHGPATEISAGPLGRFGILHGEYPPQVDTIARLGPRVPPPDPADPMALGEYLALTSCTECHGTDFRGLPTFEAPSLIIVAGYSEQDFITLMRTGVALGGRKLDLMREVALGRFSHLSDEEIRAVHTYLRTLVTRQAS